MKTPLSLITRILAPLLLMFCIHASFAGSATWDLNPGSGDWNTATNWTPTTVPASTATFALSNTTNVSISANTAVNDVIFTPAATNPYIITASPGFTLTLSGSGITNNSGTTQNFVTAINTAGNAGSIKFTNSATAGSQTAFINKGATGSLVNGGFMEFFNSSTAGNGTFTNNGSARSNSGGGFIVFSDSSTASNGIFTNNGGTAFSAGGGDTEFGGSSTAGNGTFTNNGGTVGQAGSTRFGGNSTAGNATIMNNGGFTVFATNSTAGNATINNERGGTTLFDHTSTAGNATINNNGGTVSGAGGGTTVFEGFFGTSTAGNATINNNGSTVSGAEGGVTTFESLQDGNSTAGSATIIANGGTNGGGGGRIVFKDLSTGGTSRIEVFGNGSLDISSHPVTIGSIEADGNAFLGAKTLTVGSNNLSTTFSGQISGTGGKLTKIGSGTLALSGVNTYTGNTNIRKGVLKVDGSITSNTFVQQAGTLAGTGTVHGNVTNNGTVSPGDAPGTLTVNSYTQGSDGRLLIEIAGASNGQFSVLDVLGNANLDGLLQPVLLNGFTPTIGESFTFMDYASLTGAFSDIQNQVFDHGLEQWSVTYQGTNAILTAEVGPGNVPDQASTLLLLTLSLLGLGSSRHLLRKQF